VCAEAGQRAGVVEHQAAAALVEVLKGSQPRLQYNEAEWGGVPAGRLWCVLQCACHFVPLPRRAACCVLCLD
jgi:hypothetical protein